MGHPGCGLRLADLQGKRGSQRELPVEVGRGDPGAVVAATDAADSRSQPNPCV